MHLPVPPNLILAHHRNVVLDLAGHHARRTPRAGIEVNGQRADKTNAERVWLTSWHPLKAPEGGIVGINVVAEEITERKRSEAALAAAEQRYRALVHATSSLVWTSAADGQMIDVTEWCAYTGQSLAQGWGWLGLARRIASQ